MTISTILYTKETAQSEALKKETELKKTFPGNEITTIHQVSKSPEKHQYAVGILKSITLENGTITNNWSLVYYFPY